MTRTRPEARALAASLHERLRARPESFADLAREVSDDPESASRGGALIGRPASSLPAAFLDALNQLKVSEVSRPFETCEGVHLLLRNPPPRPELIVEAVRARAMPSVRQCASAVSGGTRAAGNCDRSGE